jgi:hypothetical protein
MDYRLNMTMMVAMHRAMEDTPMVVRPIAAGPHLILNYQPGQPDGWPAGPGQSAGLTIGGRSSPPR